MSKLFDTIISRMNIENYNNMNFVIEYMYAWLYEENTNNKLESKFKNISDKEYKDLNDIVSFHLYKTIFSFMKYQINKDDIIAYFIKYIYNLSYKHARIMLYLHQTGNYDNMRLYCLFIHNNYE